MAFVFLGIARSAFGQLKSQSAALIGIIAGDLRTTKHAERGHAMIWFIDETKKINLYDPRTRQFSSIGPYMSAWNIIV